MADGIRSHRLGPPLLAALLAAAPVQAQIVTDGSVGSAGHIGRRESLPGPNVKIGAELGTRRDANLFHSFEKFNVATGQTATFTGPGAIKNVISRVTGGAVSNIDGTLVSKVGQADLYFLNPAGIMFGPNAKLAVPGSLHVSTAHELRFADGTRFSAVDKAGSGLTVAAPEAFGFLDRPPGQISINQSELQLKPGKTFSLVGGDLDLTGGTISVADGSAVGTPNPGMVFNAVSVASPGEVRVSDGAVSAAQLGSIRMADQRVTASGNGGGTVRIRAGTLTAANSAIDADNTGGWAGSGGIDLMASHLALGDSRISADTRSAAPGGAVTIKAGTMTVSNTGAAGVPDRRGIHSDTHASGDAGPVTIQAGSLTVSGSGASIKSDAQAGSAGKAGSVAITAGTLELHSSGNIGSDTFSTGQSGLVTVQADRVIINGGGDFGFTGLTSSTLHKATGTGGEIYVTARDLELRDGGAINASAYGQGDAGKVTINVTNHLLLRGFNTIRNTETRISSRAERGSSGRAGTVRVNVNRGILEVLDGGIIVADSNGVGPSGNISIQADRLIIANTIPLPPSRTTRISSRSANQSYDAGTVEVSASVLELLNGGEITSSSYGFGSGGQVTVTADKLLISGIGTVGSLPYPSKIQSEIRGSGQAAGTVYIAATELEVRDGGKIEASSTSTGAGGSIEITVANTLRMDNKAAIGTQTALARGGDIRISAGRLFELHNSTVTTAVAGGMGGGGNIFINPPLMVLDNSQIIANAQGGSGGNITIQAGQLIRSPDSKITASGIVNGNIAIAAPNTDISSSLVVLPETFLDVSSQLREACAARSGRSASSFSAGGRGGLPPDPGTPLAASPSGQPLEQQGRKAQLCGIVR